MAHRRVHYVEGLEVGKWISSKNFNSLKICDQCCRWLTMYGKQIISWSKCLCGIMVLNDGHELKPMQQIACKLWNKDSVKQMQDVVHSDHCERCLQIKLKFW
jgi:hypothetical protein